MEITEVDIAQWAELCCAGSEPESYCIKVKRQPSVSHALAASDGLRRARENIANRHYVRMHGFQTNDSNNNVSTAFSVPEVNDRSFSCSPKLSFEIAVRAAPSIARRCRSGCCQSPVPQIRPDAWQTKRFLQRGSNRTTHQCGDFPSNAYQSIEESINQ